MLPSDTSNRRLIHKLARCEFQNEFCAGSFHPDWMASRHKLEFPDNASVPVSWPDLNLRRSNSTGALFWQLSGMVVSRLVVSEICGFTAAVVGSGVFVIFWAVKPGVSDE